MKSLTKYQQNFLNRIKYRGYLFFDSSCQHYIRNARVLMFKKQAIRIFNFKNCGNNIDKKTKTRRIHVIFMEGMENIVYHKIMEKYPQLSNIHIKKIQVPLLHNLNKHGTITTIKSLKRINRLDTSIYKDLEKEVIV